jgi:hypothetical protein
MLTEDQRKLAFIGGCIPARIGLTYLAKSLETDKLKVMGNMAFIPAIVMFLLWFTNSRQIAFEAGG